MHTEATYLRLREPVELGHRSGPWRVTWLGGWDKQRVFYVVMVIGLKRSLGSDGTKCWVGTPPPLDGFTFLLTTEIPSCY